MRIGIIGVGVVGRAVYQALKNVYADVLAYDKVGEFSEEANLERIVKEADVVFVCVPSPTISMTQDLSAVHDVLGKLSSGGFAGTVVLKSTVLPGTTGAMMTNYELKIVHNPEFLTAANPYADFMAQRAVLLGGPLDQCDKVAWIYKHVLPNAQIISYPCAKITETAKYLRNNYLAVKVSLANEYHRLCEKHGIPFNYVRDAMLSQGGVEPGHWNVPGPDGKKGFSGMCLPKDIRAMISHMLRLGIEYNVLMGAEATNQVVRPHDALCKEIEGEKE